MLLTVLAACCLVPRAADPCEPPDAPAPCDALRVANRAEPPPGPRFGLRMPCDALDDRAEAQVVLLRDAQLVRVQGAEAGLAALSQRIGDCLDRGCAELPAAAWLDAARGQPRRSVRVRRADLGDRAVWVVTEPTFSGCPAVALFPDVPIRF